jgi:hypothetical protein
MPTYGLVSARIEMARYRAYGSGLALSAPLNLGRKGDGRVGESVGGHTVMLAVLFLVLMLDQR